MVGSERRADFSQLGENGRLGQPDLVKLGNDGLGIAGWDLTDRDRRVLEVLDQFWLIAGQFIDLRIEPGKETSWRIAYEFYQVPAATRTATP